MEEPTIEEYGDALNRMAAGKSGMLFVNTDIYKGLKTISAMAFNSKDDMYIYEYNLNGYMHNNSEYITALTNILNKGRKIYFIIREENFSEKFIELHKQFGFNINIRLTNKEFLEDLSTLLSPPLVVQHFYFIGDMFRISHYDTEKEKYSSLNSFDDSDTRKKMSTMFKYFLKQLVEVTTVENKKAESSTLKLPTLDETLEKFKHLGLDEKDLISIFDFSQGKIK
jgi:hypothetical protein